MEANPTIRLRINYSRAGTGVANMKLERQPFDDE